MNTLITNQQALANIYTASRLAPLNADQHILIQESASQIEKALKELEESKKPSNVAEKK